MGTSTSRRNLGRLISQAAVEQPLNKVFLADLISAIEKTDSRGKRKPSTYYKPSSFVCMRQMYFMRIGEQQDEGKTDYNSISMADTGTRRHEAIQAVLQKMGTHGYDWKYLDVSEYIKEKQAQGKCLNIEIKGAVGAETKLFDKVLGMSFMCDGIIRRISTGKDYLFEFKNQISFKFNNKSSIDEDHKPQVTCYCLCLELDEALVLYENRDVCSLDCFEVFKVTPEMKEEIPSKIFECEGYVERIIAPPKHPDSKPCRWCSYQLACRKAGN